MQKNIIALLLLLCLVLPILPACSDEAVSTDTTATDTTARPVETAPPETAPAEVVEVAPNAVIFASADFQGRNTVGGTSASGTTSDPNYNNGNAVAADILKRIIRNMQKDGYTSVDATIFCGDYDIDNGNKAGDSQAGIDAVRAVYTEMGWDTTAAGTPTTHIFVQGNHEEKAPIGTNGLSGPNRDAAGTLGVFDTEHYGLYLLHEDYHPFKSSGYTDQKIDDAAAELQAYLEAKLAADYTKPIFIAAHVPLHANLWMHSGLYAKPFFDVINDAAGKGLNIIYLFGHDHGGYDQYLGGTDIFLPAGSPILVPDRGTKATHQSYVLNFTYLCAGLNAYTIGDHSENRLSGTVLEVYDDRVVIRRYNDSTDRANNGLTNVGNVGEERPDNTAAGLLHSYYATEYPSPQTVTFAQPTTLTFDAAHISVQAVGIDSLKLTVGLPVDDGATRKLTVDVRPMRADGTPYRGSGVLSLPLPAAFADAALDELTVTAGGKACLPLARENVFLHLWVPTFAPIEITYTPTVRLTCRRVTAADLKDGGQYLLIAGRVQDISSKYNRHILSPDPFALTSPRRVGLAMVDAGIDSGAIPETLTVDSRALFTLRRDAATDSWLIGRDGEFLTAGPTSGDWASGGDGRYRVRQLNYSAAGTPFKIVDQGTDGMVYITTPVEQGAYPCYLYVTSYGNTCLMDLPKDVTAISPSKIRISYYYLFEVQS